MTCSLNYLIIQVFNSRQGQELVHGGLKHRQGSRICSNTVRMLPVFAQTRLGQAGVMSMVDSTPY